MARPYIVTDYLSDILPIATDAIQAYAWLTSNPEKEEKDMKKFLELSDKLSDGYYELGTPEGAAKGEAWHQMWMMCMDKIRESAKEYSNIREWAKECYDLMVANCPVVTGNLRDSIRFFGSGPLDIDIRIDQEELTRDKGKIPNIEPYVFSYASWQSGAEKIRARETVKLQRGGGKDYSMYADANARPRRWWAGGQKPLTRFKTHIWEYDIKQAVAEKYGFAYEIDQYEYGTGKLIVS